jgi:ElaB/YqjD/DUF883 family membrane-anchored ribosome-binding protein
MSVSDTANATREKLLEDFTKVVNDTEELLKSIATVGGDKASALRTSVEQNLALTRERLRELQETAVEKTTAAAHATDDYVHDNPWQAIGIAAAVGVVVGLLISRR